MDESGRVCGRRVCIAHTEPQTTARIAVSRRTCRLQAEMSATKPLRFRVPRAVRRGVPVVLGLALLAGLVGVLAGHRAAFVGAVRDVSWPSLVVAALLHLGTIVARSEAWATSVDAAGGRPGRRPLYQGAPPRLAAHRP